MKLGFQNKSKLTIATVTMLMALILLATGTYAWFTLSLSGKVNTMELKATAGESLRIDVQDKGESIDSWTKSEVTTADIEGQLGSGNQLSTYSLNPVTSGDGKTFFNRAGTDIVSSTKQYLEFKLWFNASKAMNVYLTEADSSSGVGDGTKVTSKAENTDAQDKIANCVRVSFTDGSTTKIYEPHKSGDTILQVGATGGGKQQTFSDAAAGNDLSKLFSLTALEAKQITVRIWIEGEDSQCIDDVKSAAFLTQLRFEGV